MEKLIQFLHGVTEDWSAFAYGAFGFVLVFGIVMASLTLRWIYLGGLGSGNSLSFLSERREIRHWINNPDLPTQDESARFRPE